jgi:hypothetical protein
MKIGAQTGSRGENTITIYDVSGRAVMHYTAVPNNQLITWSGKDELGRDVPGGVYFVHYTSKDITKTHKVILLK